MAKRLCKTRNLLVAAGVKKVGWGKQYEWKAKKNETLKEKATYYVFFCALCVHIASDVFLLEKSDGVAYSNEIFFTNERHWPQGLLPVLHTVVAFPILFDKRNLYLPLRHVFAGYVNTKNEYFSDTRTQTLRILQLMLTFMAFGSTNF